MIFAWFDFYPMVSTGSPWELRRWPQAQKELVNARLRPALGGCAEIPRVPINQLSGHRHDAVIAERAVTLEAILGEELVAGRIVREHRVQRGEVANVDRLVA